MITVQFPEPQFNIQTRGGKRCIFDAIRKTWLVLTEEEWVRQNMVAYFIQSLRYPKESIALEKEILVNGLKKRFDVLVFNRQHQPWMLVECKAPQVSLNENVLQQALRYHLTVPVQWLVITNGPATLAWKKEGPALTLAEALPPWHD
jgi:hypothetical protein